MQRYGNNVTWGKRRLATDLVFYEWFECRHGTLTLTGAAGSEADSRGAALIVELQFP